jgi:hypothetical protein
MKSIFTFVAIWVIATPVFSQWAGLNIQQEISVDKRIYNLTVARTNNDAYPDLIAFPFDEFSSVQVFRGNENENFINPVVFQKQDQYRLLNTADLDNDGIDDLILSSYWGNGFRIYWGSATGEYAEGEHYGLTGHGKNIAIEDMNGDGKPDVIAFSGGSGQPITLHFYLGTNSRTLIPNGIFSSILHTDMRITVVDKNQDGLKDIMVAASFPWFVIFYQQTGGSYKPQYWPWDLDLTKPFTSEYYMADFNNDSKEDLLAFYFDEGFRVYEGLQDTLFSANYHPTPTASRLGRIFTTDLNQDGKVDIVMENYTTDYEPTETFYYMLGNGDFTFSEPVLFDVGAPVERMIVNDFNSDDFPDVIIYSADQKIITVMNEGIVAGGEDEPFKISAYPNPFKNILEIEFDSYPMNVSIFDMQGRIQTEFVAKEKTLVQTGDWLGGLYFVRAANGYRVNQFKVVKN